MTYEEFWKPLTAVYDRGEAKAVARMAIEMGFGLSTTDIVCGKVEAIDESILLPMQQRLLTGEPVQYVLEKAEFAGHTFIVEKGVLIPRPETQELCQWIIETQRSETSPTILDIGTGSGCIACTLAAALPDASVTAWDISEKALDVARHNADRLNVSICFEQKDILQQSMANGQCSMLNGQWTMVNGQCSMFNVIVSNPPYVCEHERTDMERGVLDFEPALALFVPDDDPLLFYRSIARFASSALEPGGWLFLEANPLHINELQQILATFGFTDTKIRDDLFGKQRFVSGRRPK